MPIRLQRIYDDLNQVKGKRILVERLWPRGISKDKAKLDEWTKSLAPSPELRKWYNHDPQKWSQFKTRYIKELKKQSDDVQRIAKMAQKEEITFLYASKETEKNSANVLKKFIEDQF